MNAIQIFICIAGGVMLVAGAVSIIFDDSDDYEL